MLLSFGEVREEHRAGGIEGEDRLGHRKKACQHTGKKSLTIMKGQFKCLAYKQGSQTKLHAPTTMHLAPGTMQPSSPPGSSPVPVENTPKPSAPPSMAAKTVRFRMNSLEWTV